MSQNPNRHEMILVPQSILGFASSSGATPSTDVSLQDPKEDEQNFSKKWWNDQNTKLLIHEFKKHYEFWKNGSISKKKTMWQKIAQALNIKGLECSAEQVENRYKTLQRSYRKSRGILPRLKNTQRRFKFENEMSDIFMNDGSLLNESDIVQDIAPECVVKDHESNEDEANTDYNPFDEESFEEAPVTSNANSFFTRRQVVMPKVKFKLPRKKPIKTSVDVLTEIKELMKKVELRRQIRHEQNLKVAVERNALLKRKNELMERLLRNS